MKEDLFALIFKSVSLLENLFKGNLIKPAHASEDSYIPPMVGDIMPVETVESKFLGLLLLLAPAVLLVVVCLFCYKKFLKKPSKKGKKKKE